MVFIAHAALDEPGSTISLYSTGTPFQVTSFDSIALDLEKGVFFAIRFFNL